MAYEDLGDQERIDFHTAVIDKHSEMRTHLYAKGAAITEGEKSERERIVIDKINETISANDYAKPVGEEIAITK